HQSRWRDRVEGPAGQREGAAAGRIASSPVDFHGHARIIDDRAPRVTRRTTPSGAARLVVRWLRISSFTEHERQGSHVMRVNATNAPTSIWTWFSTRARWYAVVLTALAFQLPLVCLALARHLHGVVSTNFTRAYLLLVFL